MNPIPENDYLLDSLDLDDIRAPFFDALPVKTPPTHLEHLEHAPRATRNDAAPTFDAGFNNLYAADVGGDSDASYVQRPYYESDGTYVFQGAFQNVEQVPDAPLLRDFDSFSQGSATGSFDFNLPPSSQQEPLIDMDMDIELNDARQMSSIDNMQDIQSNTIDIEAWRSQVTLSDEDRNYTRATSQRQALPAHWNHLRPMKRGRSPSPFQSEAQQRVRRRRQDTPK